MGRSTESPGEAGTANGAWGVEAGAATLLDNLPECCGQFADMPKPSSTTDGNSRGASCPGS